MPAYFNLTLCFKREDLYPNFMKDVYAAIEQAGMRFKSGEPDFESLRLEDIVCWNQTLIEQDFVLGWDEHWHHDYRQCYFSFGDFTEVRGFWMNHYLEEESELNEFTYSIIIPEAELMPYEDYCGEIWFYSDKISLLMTFAKKLWRTLPTLCSIQTGIELSDLVTSTMALRQGKSPLLCPFAVIPQELRLLQTDIANLAFEDIERDGLLIIDTTQIVTGP